MNIRKSGDLAQTGTYYDARMGGVICEADDTATPKNDQTANITYAISLAGTKAILFPPGDYKIDVDLTISSDVITVKGTRFDIASGKTLTFAGNFEGDLSQHFTGAGTISFAGNKTLERVYPEWWGNNTTPGTTDMTSPIQKAINAMEGTYSPYAEITGCGCVLLSKTIYAITAIEIKTGVLVRLSDGTVLRSSGTITMNSSSALIGSGLQRSYIRYSGTGHAISCDSSGDPGAIVDVKVLNFWLNCTVATTTNSGIFFTNVNHPTIEWIKTTDTPTGAPFIEIVRSTRVIINAIHSGGSYVGASPTIKIYNDSDIVDISHCRLGGLNAGEGILIDNPGAGNNTNVHIHDNDLAYFDVAIRIGQTALSTVTLVKIDNNYFDANVTYEIVVGHVANNSMAKNIAITNNYFYPVATAVCAVYVAQAQNIRIIGNRSLNHTTRMVEVLAGVKNFSILNNNITDPARQSIATGATGVYDDASGNLTYNGLTLAVDSISPLTASKEFGITFPTGVANQKVDLYMTGTQEFWGSIDVEVVGSYSGGNSAGLIKKNFGLGLSAGGTIFANEGRYVEESGVIANNFAISDISWDAGNSRYKITIVHRLTTANYVTIKLSVLAFDASQKTNFLTFTIGSIYTTDATVYTRPEIAYNGNVLFGASIISSVQAGITASTTQTQGQGALTKDINQVSVCANPNDTVTLPTAVAGMSVTVINSGAQTLRIFPASGDNLGAGVDTATTLATTKSARFESYDATNWIAFTN